MAQTQPFNFARSQLTADAMIRRWGTPSILRRASGDRPCWAGVFEYTAVEAQKFGRLYNPTDRRCLISVFMRDVTKPNSSLQTLLVQPDSDQDVLVRLRRNSFVEFEVLRIYAPLDKLQPGDMTVMYDLRVRAGTT